jgi:hypothetical protein
MAFGIGCSLGGMVSMALLLVVFVLGGRDWTLLAIFALVAILISAGVSALLATRAKKATIDATYERVVRPEIDGFVRANRLTRLEFDAEVDKLVPASAPLRSFLTLPPRSEEGDATLEE